MQNVYIISRFQAMSSLKMSAVGGPQRGLWPTERVVGQESKVKGCLQDDVLLKSRDIAVCAQKNYFSDSNMSKRWLCAK